MRCVPRRPFIYAMAAILALVAIPFPGFVRNAHAQIKKGAKLPPNFNFGFEPDRNVFYEGIFRIDGNPKRKMEVLSRLVADQEKSVVVYTRMTDDATFKFIADLDAKGDTLKDCPTHIVFLYADRDSIAKKCSAIKTISLWQSNRKTPQDWGIFEIDPKLATMALLVQRGTIQTKLEVMEGMLTDKKMSECTKAILDFGAWPSTSPVGIQDLLAGHPGGARSLTFSPDGKWLYSHGAQQDNGNDARIRKWELTTGKQLADVASHVGSASGLQVTRDGKTLLSIGHNMEVKFWDAADLNLIDTLKLTVTPFSLRISPDQKSFAVGGGLFRDNPIRIFDLATKTEKFTLKGHQDRVRAIDFSPDSKLLVSGDEQGKIKLWNVVDGKEIATWPGHTNTVECIAFSPDGKWVASGGREMRGVSGPGRARLWDVEAGKEVRQLDSTRVGGVLAIVFLDGGKKLAIAGESPVLRFIDLSTGKEAGELDGHRSPILSLALSPDHSILASGEWNATIRLWNWSGKNKQ